MGASPPLAGTGPARGATARLLVLASGEEVAKKIENHLRNAGHAVRAAWVTDLEDVEDAVRRNSAELLLCHDNVPKAPPKEVLKICHQINPELPVVLLASKAFTMADTVAALRIGMRALVTAGDALQMQHLETICLRELGTYFQVRDLRSTRLRLADYEARHEKLMAGTADAVIHVQEGIVTHANAAFASLLGHAQAADIEGNPLMDLVAPEGQPQVKAFLKAFAQGKARADVPLPLVLAAHDGRTVSVSAQVTVGAAEEDRMLELLIRAEAPASASAPGPGAVPAPVSGPGLLPTLKDAIDASARSPRALMVLMVDGFTDVEQRIGYHESELALAALADRVSRRLAPGESLFRFSTALVAMIVARPGAKDFDAFAEQLRREVAATPFKTDNFEAQLTVTVLSYPLSPTDKAVEVIDASVREARKLSRTGGGNRTATLGAAAQAAEAAAVDQRKADQIKRALAENRLKLAYQSIASLEGGDRQHYDVLARMLDEKGQEVPARDFIPAAEKYGLIVAIDRWVIAKALAVLAKRTQAASTSSLFVRLSEQSVREGDAFMKWLEQALKPRPLRKEELVVSIQETIVETHVVKAKVLSKALRGLGAQVAMDYYGVGNNSVAMLAHLEPQYVRFHYSFTKDIGNAILQKKMAELLQAAKERGIKTIVGQVEDANAMALLWQLGANYIQGYHIQAPEAVLLATDVR